MEIENIKFVVKHEPTQKLFFFRDKEEAQRKQIDLNDFYKVTNRYARSKAVIMTVSDFCETEKLSYDELKYFKF